ncbi:MAG TPA: hypothetical protein VI916_15570 [Acidimicrobiia bacterium]|nr:hypothetical protein [Acidimicrobiia bacterium]
MPTPVRRAGRRVGAFAVLVSAGAHAGSRARFHRASTMLSVVLYRADKSLVVFEVGEAAGRGARP